MGKAKGGPWGGGDMAQERGEVWRRRRDASLVMCELEVALRHPSREVQRCSCDGWVWSPLLQRATYT